MRWTRQATLLDRWPFPHPWLAGERGDRDAFARCVVHADRDPVWTSWAIAEYADRWGPDELVSAIRHARRLAPLPAWAAQLLRVSIGRAA